MAIFNGTFTDDKPIIYPSTWQTGKTAPELYEQWKLTMEYFILSNLVQCLIAGAWMCFVIIVLNAIYEMIRLYRLPDDSRQRLSNRHYISKKFILSISWIAFIVMSVTIAIIIIDEFLRYALMKGLVTALVCIQLKKVFPKIKSFLYSCRNKYLAYRKLKDDSDDND